jgi:hypothetical protein
MIFTVITYLPLIEEEPVASKVELLKKTQSSGSDDNEGDPDNDPSNYKEHNFKFPNLPQTDRHFISSFSHYFYLEETGNNPPPKV